MSSPKSSYKPMIDIAIIAILVISVRMLIEKLLPLFYERFGLHFSDFLFQNLANYPLTIAMVTVDFLLVFYLTRRMEYASRTVLKSMLEFLGVILISLLASLCLRLYQKASLDEEIFLFDKLFFFTVITNILFNAIIVLLIDIVMYYRWSHRKAIEQEVLQKTKADYQYQLLKGQLNPHFLFNSLNVLDYLIQTDPEKASNYVKRLAGVYRYLLKIESNPIVLLEEEIAFVKQYNNLLLERFGVAINVDMDVSSHYRKKKIVPCGIQMHIENAVKHNVVNKDNVLCVEIYVEADYLIIKNNIQKKYSVAPSTGLGLLSLRRQYEMLFRKEIYISQTEDFFEVKVPLID